MGLGVRVLSAAAAACAIASAGCDVHLLGTRDVRLEYEVTADSSTNNGEESLLEHASHAVGKRLAAAQVSADIDVSEPSRLVVTIDKGAASGVVELLGYRGGLAVCRLDRSYRFTPENTSGLTEKREPIGEGDARIVEDFFVGAADDVLRAARSAKVDAGHRIVVETYGHDARTLAVVWPPLVDLTEGIANAEVEHGTTLALTLTPAAGGRLHEAEGRAGGERVAFVRDWAVSSVETLPPAPPSQGEDTAPLRLHLGDSLVAYTRAEHLRRLLESGTLPTLTPAATEHLPPKWPLAITSLLLPMVLSLAWLSFVRRFDRARPEPLWLVMVTFALGGFSVVPAGLAEILLPTLSPYLSPELMTLGGQLFALPIALVVFTLVVGVSEEGSKFLAAWIIARKSKEFDEPVDGIVYGAAAALGFAAVENIRYFVEGRLSPTLVVSRALMTVPAHLFFGAIWGYALGKKLVVPKTPVLGYLLWAAAMHGAFDAFLSIHGTGALALLVNLALASIFIGLLRKSLRHGVVSQAAANVDPASRALFAMGSRGAFVAYTIGMHVAAALIFILGAYVEARHGRVGFGFLGVATVLTGVFGVMAGGLVRTMPLDVVVDDFGVTFAGAAVPWSAVTALERRPAGPGGLQEIRLGTSDGPLRLGPGPAATVDALAHALTSRAEATAPR